MGDAAYADSGGLAIARIYQFLIIPIAIAVSVVMIFLRPIYVLTLCEMYSDYLKKIMKKQSCPMILVVEKSYNSFLSFLCIGYYFSSLS